MAAPYVPTPLRWVNAISRRADVARRIEHVGFMLAFVWDVFRSIPLTMRHYRAETVAQITGITWGRGAVVVGGGTASVMVIMGAAVGASIGIEAYSSLDLLALGQLTGLVSAFANTRELAPIAAGIGFAAQAGCRMTAEIGSKRISEEIDAMEALGVRSVPYVVTTRVIAGVVSVVPTFLVSLIVSYMACAAIVSLVHDQPTGVYDHYFAQFVVPWDVVAATIKVVVFAIAVIVIHCYQGFFATGGPEGVGSASGRAIRASIVVIIALDMIMTIFLWGFTSPISFTG